MANVIEQSLWEVGVYQIETSDAILGGVNGIANRQALQLANRTLWLKNQIADLGTNKQPVDATLTALANLTTAADQIPYATGADTFAMTPLTPFARTLLYDANAAAALSTLGAAPAASPALTGTPTAPTAAVDTSTTQVATTAFVTNQAASTTPIVDGTAAVGTSKRYARADHVHPTDTSLAPVASPTLTGVPTAPTATAETASSQLATTAHVHSVFDLRTYKSPDLSIANSGSVTVEHGLGSVPVGVFVSLKCAVAEMGYAVGDVIVLSPQADPTSAVEGLSVIKTATQLIASVCANGPGEYPIKTGGDSAALTAAKWKLILTAIK